MSRKAIFLDRDDTLIDDPGYIRHPDQVELLPGVPEAIVQFKNMGFLIIVVTNQSGIARGFFTEEELEDVHHRLKNLLNAEGAAIDGIYYCPYHPEGNVKDFSIESNLRKPNAGMFFQAEEEFDIDLKDSWMIGDSYRDIKAGHAAGCHTILVDVPGKIREKHQDDPEPERKAVNLREAVNIVRMVEFHKKAQSARKPFSENRDSAAIDKSGPVYPESEEQVIEQLNDSDTDQSDSIQIADAHQDTPPEILSPKPERETDTKPVGLSESTKVYTAKKVTNSKDIDETKPETKTHHLLEELLHQVQKNNRKGLYREFSLCKLLSLMIQVIAVFCLIISLFFWLNPDVESTPVLIMIGYAAVLQLIVIALQIMHSND